MCVLRVGRFLFGGCGGAHVNNNVAAISGRPMMKFESGYTVETVFDGSKLGIEPYSVEILPNGELLILDSANSNLYRISSSLSLCKYSLLVFFSKVQGSMLDSFVKTRSYLLKFLFLIFFVFF